MYRRNIETSLRKALDDTRVVLLHGARQVGKSTLAQRVAAERGGGYFTLDDATTLATARGDPAALVRATLGLTVIDEVQKAPELFPAIKVEVDRDRRPGRFLLTGSAHVFLLPRLSESLAGRMEVLILMPLGQDEMAGHATSLPDALFSDDTWEMRSAPGPGGHLRARDRRGIPGGRGVGRAALGVVSELWRPRGGRWSGSR